MSKRIGSVSDWVKSLFLTSMLSIPRILPYHIRIPFGGWLVTNLVVPFTNYNARIRTNLSLIYPDMTEAEKNRMCKAVTNNAGRTLAEGNSVTDFISRMATTPIGGPGAVVLEAALKDKVPIVFVSGHFGSYEAPRAALTLAGHKIGGLYRPFTNPYFDRYYRAMITRMGAPIFPQTSRGLAGMMRHLRAGNPIALLVDQHDRDGEILSFMGKPARSPLSAAKMALKYDALLVSGVGIRKENGLDFEIWVDPPIPHSDAATMTQAINDNLEAQVRDHVEQYLWIHRRWRELTG